MKTPDIRLRKAEFIEQNALKLWLTGSVYHENRKLSGSEFLDFFIDNGKPQLNKLSQLWGSFCWIIHSNATIWIGGDTTNSQSLFYVEAGKSLIITDSTDSVSESERGDLNPPSVVEYLCCGYVNKRRTLYKNMYQVQSGESVIFDLSGTKQTIFERWFKFQFHQSTDDTNDQKQKLIDLTEQLAHYVTDLANGRTILLPLSGGLDSRLLAAMLKDKTKNIHTFCYGRDNSPEIKTSRLVAKKFGLRWFHIPYENKKWVEARKSASYFNDLIDLSDIHAGVANIQEFPAIWELSKTYSNPKDVVLVGGQLGDLLAGGRSVYDPNPYLLSTGIDKTTAWNHINHYDFSLWKKLDIPFRFEGSIHDSLFAYWDSHNFRSTGEYCDIWNYYERQSKFIMKMNRVYQAFGFDWIWPFTHPEYIQFWMQTEAELRFKKTLYKQVIAERTGIPLEQASKQGLAERLKETMQDSPILQPAKRIYRSYMAFKKKQTAIDEDPLASFGLVDPEEFKRLFTGYEKPISFQAFQNLNQLLGFKAKTPQQLFDSI